MHVRRDCTFSFNGLSVSTLRNFGRTSAMVSQGLFYDDNLYRKVSMVQSWIGSKVSTFDVCEVHAYVANKSTSSVESKALSDSHSCCA